MDYVYGDYSLEFEVDGKKAGVCECPGTDRINRWRWVRRARRRWGLARVSCSR